MVPTGLPDMFIDCLIETAVRCVDDSMLPQRLFQRYFVSNLFREYKGLSRDGHISF